MLKTENEIINDKNDEKEINFVTCCCIVSRKC